MKYKKIHHYTHTNLTALSPIEYRPDDPERRVATIRATLAQQAKLKPQDQILRRCPMVHMARLQVIDDLLPAMGAHPVDSLKSKYLLLVADIDGDVDAFLDALYNGPQSPFDWVQADADSKKHSEFVRNVWGQCIGYPRQTGSVFFRQYIRRCRIKTTLPYAAYSYSVADIVRAKERQATFAEFVKRVQGMKADDLYAEWKKFKSSDEQDAPGQSRSDPDDRNAETAPDTAVVAGMRGSDRETSDRPHS